MRRLRLWGIGTVLLVGVGGIGLAGEAPSGGGAKPALRPLFSTTPKKPPVTQPAGSPMDDAAMIVKREEAAYWRRVAVCDKLTDIALQTNDTELHDRAEQLQQRAFEVYMARVNGLPKSVGDTDEQRLQQGIDNLSSAGARLEQGARTPTVPKDARSGLAGLFRR